jgi:hypothetical protein
MNPDAAKIRAYLARLKAVPAPELETVEGQEIVAGVRRAVEAVEGQVEELIRHWEAETPR